ncbi:MAG: beta-lactamase family protein [Chitinophagaceae bacterium]|nr:beta-lactamase family protein [Chitinophagaceae bacterium]
MSFSKVLHSGFLPFFIGALFVFNVSNTSCKPGNKKGAVAVDSTTFIKLPATEAVSAAETERIRNAARQWYDSVLKRRNFNGGMIVAKGGTIIFEQYSGTGHLKGADTLTQHSPLHIASITKTFTAMAVLNLWQDSLLQIDDEFSKYFPAFNYPGITIRNLLSHRSGLPNYNYFMEKLGWDKSRYISNTDVLQFLITRKAELEDISTPNTRFNYCNTNYALLALLIEKVSGITYADYLDKTFFKPLQMHNSYVFKMADTAKALPSYNWRGGLEPFNFLDQVYGDKNIYSTPRDLLVWDQALSGNGLFTNETLEQAYTPYSNERPGIRNYGLGWRMNIIPDGNPQGSVNKVIYHNGWWHGSNATFIRLLKEQATIIVIGNRFTRSVYHAKDLISVFGKYYIPADEEETGSITETVLPDASIPVKVTQDSRKSKRANRRSDNKAN